MLRSPTLRLNPQLNVHDLIPLNLLATGQSGQISEVVGLPDDVHRLQEIGLRGGTQVEMVRSGSPCIIRLGGQKLCLRADELTHILVRPGAVS